MIKTYFLLDEVTRALTELRERKHRAVESQDYEKAARFKELEWDLSRDLESIVGLANHTLEMIEEIEKGE